MSNLRYLQNVNQLFILTFSFKLKMVNRDKLEFENQVLKVVEWAHIHQLVLVFLLKLYHVRLQIVFMFVFLSVWFDFGFKLSLV